MFHGQGNQVITLGTEAFKWYAPYREGDRFEEKLVVNLTATDDQGNSKQKSITLLPLPHPSPLNKRYYAIFPEILQHRLNFN